MCAGKPMSIGGKALESMATEGRSVHGFGGKSHNHGYSDGSYELGSYKGSTNYSSGGYD
ncbi:MAG: hypothetical protein ABIH49_00585 [archaeon]